MEFLPDITGLSSFDQSFKNCEKLNLDGNEISILSYEDLISNKKAVGREIDRSDIDELEKKKKDNSKAEE